MYFYLAWGVLLWHRPPPITTQYLRDLDQWEGSTLLPGDPGLLPSLQAQPAVSPGQGRHRVLPGEISQHQSGESRWGNVLLSRPPRSGQTGLWQPRTGAAGQRIPPSDGRRGGTAGGDQGTLSLSGREEQQYLSRSARSSSEINTIDGTKNYLDRTRRAIKQRRVVC